MLLHDTLRLAISPYEKGRIVVPMRACYGSISAPYDGQQSANRCHLSLSKKSVAGHGRKGELA